jgi:hypothetical protein
LGQAVTTQATPLSENCRGVEKVSWEANLNILNISGMKNFS